jgi:hypothetical protein
MHKRFVLGVDRSKMKLYDVEQGAQDGISDAGQNNSPKPPAPHFGKFEKKKDFSGFKV